MTETGNFNKAGREGLEGAAVLEGVIQLLAGLQMLAEDSAVSPEAFGAPIYALGAVRDRLALAEHAPQSTSTNAAAWRDGEAWHASPARAWPIIEARLNSIECGLEAINGLARHMQSPEILFSARAVGGETSKLKEELELALGRRAAEPDDAQ